MQKWVNRYFNIFLELAKHLYICSSFLRSFIFVANRYLPTYFHQLMPRHEHKAVLQDIISIKSATRTMIIDCNDSNDCKYSQILGDVLHNRSVNSDRVV